jgi:hypothetical protein
MQDISYAEKVDITRIRERHRTSAQTIDTLLEMDPKAQSIALTVDVTPLRARHRFSQESINFWGMSSTLAPREFWKEFKRPDSPITVVDAVDRQAITQEITDSGKYTSQGTLQRGFKKALETLVSQTGIEKDLKVEAMAILRTSARLSDTNVPQPLLRQLVQRVASTTLSWVWGAIKATVNSEVSQMVLNTGVQLMIANTVHTAFGSGMPIVGEIAGSLAIQGLQNIKATLQNPGTWTRKSVVRSTFAVVGNVATGMLINALPGGPVVQQFIGAAVGNMVREGSALLFEGMVFGRATVVGDNTTQIVETLLSRPVPAVLQPKSDVAFYNTNRSNIMMGIKVGAVASAAALMIVQGHGIKVAKIGWKYIKEDTLVREIAVTGVSQLVNIPMKYLVRKSTDVADHLLEKAGLKEHHIIPKRLRDRLRETIFHAVVERLTIAGLVRNSLTITGQIGANMGAKYAVDTASTYKTVAEARTDILRMYTSAHETVQAHLTAGKHMLEPSIWFNDIDRAHQKTQDINAFTNLMKDRIQDDQQKVQDINDFSNLMKDRIRDDQKKVQDINDFSNLMKDRIQGDQQRVQDINAFSNLMKDRIRDNDKHLRDIHKDTFIQAMHAPFDTMLQDLEDFQDTGYATFDNVLDIDIVNAFKNYMGETKIEPIDTVTRYTGVLYSVGEMLLPLPGKAGKIFKVATGGLNMVKKTTKAGTYLAQDSVYAPTMDYIDSIMDKYVPDLASVGFDHLKHFSPTTADAIDGSTAFNPIWQGFVASGGHPTRSWTNGAWKMGLGEGAGDFIDFYFGVPR